MRLRSARPVAVVALLVLPAATACAAYGGAAAGAGAKLGEAAPAKVAVGTSSAPAPAQPANPPKITQLMTVTATSHRATYARFVAYHWSRGHWVKKFGPWTARVGYNGIAAPGTKSEGDGKTPSGDYGFQFFFGVLRNPGVAFQYRRARTYDVWDDDPSSPNYNEWIDKRSGKSYGRNPEPMDNTPAYNYGAVIAYNTKRVPHLGSAIFLHVGIAYSTAGCVSLPQPELLDVLRWMRPSEDPHIVISVRR